MASRLAIIVVFVSVVVAKKKLTTIFEKNGKRTRWLHPDTSDALKNRQYNDQGDVDMEE